MDIENMNQENTPQEEQKKEGFQRNWKKNMPGSSSIKHAIVRKRFIWMIPTVRWICGVAGMTPGITGVM